MNFIVVLFFLVMALFVITIKFVIDGARGRDWKKLIISILIFLGIVVILYFGLIWFITSM